MAQLGADVEQLDRLARTFQTEGTRLEQSASTLRSLVANVTWTGPDAAQFRGQFNQRTSQQLLAAARALHEESRDLARQASEQRATSTDATGAAVGAGAGGGARSADGAVPTASPFANQMGGNDPRALDLDMAKLADNAYEPSANVGNWRKLSTEELAAAGLSPTDLENPNGRGLRAAVYESNGRYVVAFAGTDPLSPGDLGTDIDQAVGIPTWQYQQASAIAQRANAAFGNDLVFTGDSLGGGLASYAALQTGRPAVTFNAAGLHDNMLDDTPGTFGPATPDEARQQAASGLVRSYHVANEPLSGVQQGSGIDGVDALPDAVGHRIELSDPGLGYKLTNPGEIGGHGIGTVIRSMERDQPWAR